MTETWYIGAWLDVWDDERLEWLTLTWLTPQQMSRALRMLAGANTPHVRIRPIPRDGDQ